MPPRSALSTRSNSPKEPGDALADAPITDEPEGRAQQDRLVSQRGPLSSAVEVRVTAVQRPVWVNGEGLKVTFSPLTKGKPRDKRA